MLAPVRDKTCLFTRVNSFPPLTPTFTDWHESNICAADFGVGEVLGFWHLFDAVTEGLIVVYPPRKRKGDEQEVCEFVVTIEKEVVGAVLKDEEPGTSLSCGGGRWAPPPDVGWKYMCRRRSLVLCQK